MPSGAQYWYRQIVATCRHRFAYCSTLAVYICNATTHSIESIISGHEGTITCIEWNQLDENMLASASAENQLYIWNIEQESATLCLTLTSYAVSLQWSQTDANTLLLLLATGTLSRVCTKT